MLMGRVLIGHVCSSEVVLVRRRGRRRLLIVVLDPFRIGQD